MSFIDSLVQAHPVTNFLSGNQGEIRDAIFGDQTFIPDAARNPTLGNSTNSNFDFAQTLANRNSMPGAQINMAPQADFRDQQLGFAHQLAAQAAGQGGPSLAQGQLQQATDQNMKNQMALAASQRGINPGMAARIAGQNAAMAGQEAAQQSAQLRAQEMLAAQGMLGNALSQGRAQDIGLGTSQAQLNQNNQQMRDNFSQMLYQTANQRDLGLMNGQIQGGIGAAGIDEQGNKRRAWGQIAGPAAQGAQGFAAVM